MSLRGETFGICRRCERVFIAGYSLIDFCPECRAYLSASAVRLRVTNRLAPHLFDRYGWHDVATYIPGPADVVIPRIEAEARAANARQEGLST